VKSAGNGGEDRIGHDGNGNAVDASRFTVSVGALDKVGQITSYSNHGAHLLVSAPAGYWAEGTVTTDLMGEGAGYNGLLNGDYTNKYNGTSAAGPITAGVVALMLDTNANLGWRDVHNILSYSAIGTGSLYTGNRTNESELWNWKWNGADNWNGGGLHYSEDYGYGLVNAYTAARFSEVWSMLHASAQKSSNELSTSTGWVAVNREISERSPLSYTFNISQNISLEHVSLTVNLQHTNFTNLRIQLVSPEGTMMSLYDGSSGNSSTSDYGLTYTFGVDGLRGEMSAGAWTLQLQDDVLGDAGVLNFLSFRGFGSALSSNDIYHYTDEVLQVLAQNGQSTRSTLRDADGGIDWLNASAMWRDAIIDLNAGGACTLAGQTFAVMDSTGGIENAVCGDGNDRIVGSALSNTLMGMRGNDVIIGGKGDDVINGGDGFDTAIFAGNSNEYNLSLSGQTVIVTDKFVNRDGSDKLSFVERLKFTDSVIAFDTDGNAGQGYRIYEAAFDRKPDATGLGYWITQIDKGTSLETVADGFLSSTEFNTLYGSSSTNSSFVDNLYRNILDRAGDKAGIDYWTGVLNNGMSRAEVLIGFSESHENQVGVIGAIQNGIEYKEWLG
jgi:subtilisin-like proprotein convertase family protein